MEICLPTFVLWLHLCRIENSLKNISIQNDNLNNEINILLNLSGQLQHSYSTPTLHSYLKSLSIYLYSLTTIYNILQAVSCIKDEYLTQKTCSSVFTVRGSTEPARDTTNHSSYHWNRQNISGPLVPRWQGEWKTTTQYNQTLLWAVLYRNYY